MAGVSIAITECTDNIAGRPPSATASKIIKVERRTSACPAACAIELWRVGLLHHRRGRCTDRRSSLCAACLCVQVLGWFLYQRRHGLELHTGRDALIGSVSVAAVLYVQLRCSKRLIDMELEIHKGRRRPRVACRENRALSLLGTMVPGRWPGIVVVCDHARQLQPWCLQAPQMQLIVPSGAWRT